MVWYVNIRVMIPIMISLEYDSLWVQDVTQVYIQDYWLQCYIDINPASQFHISYLKLLEPLYGLSESGDSRFQNYNTFFWSKTLNSTPRTETIHFITMQIKVKTNYNELWPYMSMILWHLELINSLTPLTKYRMARIKTTMVTSLFLCSNQYPQRVELKLHIIHRHPLGCSESLHSSRIYIIIAQFIHILTIGKGF